MAKVDEATLKGNFLVYKPLCFVYTPELFAELTVANLALQEHKLWTPVVRLIEYLTAMPDVKLEI